MTASDSTEQNNSDQNDDFFNEEIHSNNFASIRQFLCNKLWALKVHNYKTKNIREFAKYLRRKIKFNRTPKKKGYGQYFTEEERRYNSTI